VGKEKAKIKITDKITSFS